ncbi:hypothetical protein WJX75_002142 [Coccomyxa subellipsoidea]|uniref:RING-type domain-containing protein n=1 Tax=Coccomyxa subellipsoidea TaxID=248742 RepID=A0ABR2YXR2_9CHLO
MQRHALSILVLLCILSILPRILTLRAPKNVEDAHGGQLQVVGAREFLGSCIDISLLLSGSVHEYSSVLGHSTDIRGNATLDDAACLLTAEVRTDGSDGGQTECDSHIWDMRESDTGAESFTQRLRLHSTCDVVGMGLQVMRDGVASKHRRLADSTSPSANMTAPNQTIPIVPGSGGSNSQGPSSGIACCCGQNNQNCTAIFVGSTLIAGALISFMTCGICIYRARSSLQEPATFWARSGGRLRENAARRPRRPLPTTAPPAEEEGTVRECPVCLEETTSNAQWVIFGCHHATCRTCYAQLVAKPHQDAACPLCRSPLTELVPEEGSSQVAIQMQPLEREPAGPSRGQVPVGASPVASSSSATLVGG